MTRTETPEQKRKRLEKERSYRYGTSSYDPYPDLATTVFLETVSNSYDTSPSSLSSLDCSSTPDTY